MTRNQQDPDYQDEVLIEKGGKKDMQSISDIISTRKRCYSGCDESKKTVKRQDLISNAYRPTKIFQYINRGVITRNTTYIPGPVPEI
jgi:hypothetical protein